MRLGLNRWILPAFLAFSALLAAPQTVAAHAELLSSQPEAGQRLGTAPGAVVLEFSESLEPRLSTVTVTDPTGRRFTGAVTTGEEMRIQLATNAPGIYTVQWTSVSSTDGHELSASFQFGVGVTPGAPGAAQAPPVSASAILLTVARWAEALSLLLAAGMIVVSWLASRAPPLPWVRPRLQVLSVAFAAGLVVVWGEAAIASGGPSLSGLENYLATGPPGLARIARLLFEALAAASAAWSWSRLWPSIFVAGAFIGLAASGHGASANPAWWGITANAVHLTAAAIWAGGILALAWQRPPDGWRSPQGIRLLSRFSPIALPAFGVTVVFGLIQAVQELGSFRALIDTTYGQVLIAKAALVAAMIPLSLIAWRLRRPHFRLEAPLAALVVGAAASLAAFPIPPGQLVAKSASAGQSGFPRAGDLTFGEHAGSVLVGLTLEPAVPGENRAVIYLLPLTGARGASSLSATLSVDGAASQKLTACGTTCRETRVNLRGGETVTVAVPGRGGGTATFRIPSLPAADGAAPLTRAQQRMHQLHSYQLLESLTTGAPGVTPIVDRYTYGAPDRMMSVAANGAQLVWIGTTQYRRNQPNQPWQVTSGLPLLHVPSFTWDYFTPFIDPRIVGRSVVDGVPTTIVSFFGRSNATPVWFRLWIDDSGLVRRAEMHAQGHNMLDLYSDFDAAPPVATP
jgi:copper transport protein